MLKGTIYVTYDANLCLANLNTCKTIAIVDEPDMCNIPGKIGGSLLLPPYEALACIIDGDDDKFNSYYITYLCTDINVQKFTDIILQALIAGTNMIFLLDPEGPKFDMTLKEYFRMTFGIILGDESRPFQYDLNGFPNILNRLYANDSIGKEYFLKLYPINIPFDMFISQKLAFDHGIYYVNEEANQAFFKSLSRKIQNGGIIRDVIKRV